MPDNLWLLAANHTGYVNADEQVISELVTQALFSGSVFILTLAGITKSEMLQLGHFELDYFLSIQDVEGANWDDDQRPREFLLKSRRTVLEWLSTE